MSSETKSNFLLQSKLNKPEVRVYMILNKA